MPNGKELANLIQPIFISVDPKRDTIDQIKEYTKGIFSSFLSLLPLRWPSHLFPVEFHPRLLGMTGTKDEIAQVAKAYRVYFSTSQVDEHDASEDYLVDHSIFIYLMDPNGEILDYFGQNKSSKDIATALQGHLSSFLQKK